MSKSDYKNSSSFWAKTKQKGFGDVKIKSRTNPSRSQKKASSLSFPAKKTVVVALQQPKTTVKNGQPLKTSGSFISKFSSGKIYAAVSATFVLTLGISFAGSQVLAHISQNSNQNNVLIDSQEQILPVTSQPSTLNLNPVVITNPTLIYLPIEKIQVPDPLSQRKAFLTSYLESKNSPLAEHVDELSDQTQWKLIIAIANAESSYCKHNSLNDCWGIGGAWNLKAYSNYDQAITDVNNILEQNYISAGLNTPDKIESKWVGYKDSNWEAAANQVMNDLKNVQ